MLMNLVILPVNMFQPYAITAIPALPHKLAILVRMKRTDGNRNRLSTSLSFKKVGPGTLKFQSPSSVVHPILSKRGHSIWSQKTIVKIL